MSKKFKIKIKYCVKPQTVLTVQKENAFFAASIGTSATVCCYIPGLLRIPRLPLLPLQTKPFSRWTDQRDTLTATSAAEGPAGDGKAASLPREAVCGWWPLQSPSVAFWRAPARARSSSPRWGNAKSDAAAFQRRRPPRSVASQGNFSTQGYHLHPPLC